jgi:hypothetical protein
MSSRVYSGPSGTSIAVSSSRSTAATPARSCNFFSTTKLSIGLIEGPPRDRGIGTVPFMQDELVLIMLPAFASDHMSRGQLLAGRRVKLRWKQR